MMTHSFRLAALALAVAACRAAPPAEERTAAPPPGAGALYTVRDTTVPAILDAAGVAEPVLRATLSTKLMGTVTAVLVREGDHVRRGQLLARIDARDIAAQRAQASASLAEAEAVRRDAAVQAQRFRALYADSAAPRAQLDAAETGLARADAAVRAARAAAAGVQAVGGYAEIRAPFDGIVTARAVDPGALAAPGTPLLTVQDPARLRIVVTASPAAVRAILPGAALDATVEGVPARAVVEGIVPAASGALYTVNAIVPNTNGAYAAGGAATLALVQGTRATLFVPARALERQGDLAGVRVRAGTATELRFVKPGRESRGVVEVLAGLRAGEQVVLPAPLAAEAR